MISDRLEVSGLGDRLTVRDMRRIGSAISDRAIATNDIGAAISAAATDLEMPRYLALIAFLFYREV